MRATKVNAGLTESNGKVLMGVWRDSLRVTSGLTACTPGSAAGPTLGNEYGKTLPYLTSIHVGCWTSDRNTPLLSFLPRPLGGGLPPLVYASASGIVTGTLCHGHVSVSVSVSLS